MTNLVWDDTRTAELREKVERTIVDFLESFADFNGHDSYHVAVRVGRTLEIELENLVTDAPHIPFVDRLPRTW